MSTRISPYKIILDAIHHPCIHVAEQHTTAILDPREYSNYLCQKLFDISELVDANIVHSVDQQQHHYHFKAPSKLREGQKLLLDNPTKGKLDPCRTGPWVVLQCNDPTSVRLKMGTRRQMILCTPCWKKIRMQMCLHIGSTPFQYWQ